MKFTMYLKVQNQKVIKRENLTMRQIAFLFGNLNARDISFKYNIVKTSKQKTVLSVNRIQHNLLDSENLLFKLRG